MTYQFYRGRGAARSGLLPILIILMLLLVAGALFLQGCRAVQTDGEAALPREEQSEQPGQAEAPQEQPPEKPEKVTTASGIACTLQELGEEAIATGELILVNNQHHYRFPEETDLVCIYENKTDSYIVARTDTVIAPATMEALNALLDDFRAQGGSKSVNVVAGYRTEEFQQHLFDQSAQRNGLEHAEKYVAQPGGSEHHTGYAVDFSVLKNGVSHDYDGSGEYEWINANCQRYGYIVRYEAGKETLTGIWDEPWHFRYLGEVHAGEVTRRGMCLEEYIDCLKDYTFEGEHLTIRCEAGEYEVWYTEGTEVYLPDSGEYTVSGNNVDGVIVTCKVA